MQIWKTNGRWFQMFKYVGDKFMNERGMYVGVQNKENIVTMKSVNNSWSRWNVRYVKDEQNYQTGEFHPGYGLVCNKSFYIVSQRGGRYLDSVDSKAVIKTRNGRSSQQWKFDCNKLAIVDNRNYVLQRGGNGG